MRRLILAGCIAVTLALGLAHGVGAQTLDASISLAATPPAASPGETITYTIKAHWAPAGAGPEFDFQTPLGTTLLDASAGAGAQLLEAGFIDDTIVRGGDPAFAAKVRGRAPQLRFALLLSAVDGTAQVRVQVTPIWQGPPISAQAYFRGSGVPQSEVVTTPVAAPTATGLLAVRRFIDLDGDLQQDIDDVPETCGFYVYSADLIGAKVPDDVVSPTDPRLPLVAFGTSDSTGSAAFPLATGRYAVYTASCDDPPPPGGPPQTSFDVAQQPPATKIASVSGASHYDVQVVDVVAPRQTDALTGERPVGTLAPPTNLEFSSALTWTDNATGETGYHVSVFMQNGVTGEFDLPANTTSFTIPPQFFVPCGATEGEVRVAADDADGRGYAGKFQVGVIADCAFPPQPVTAPNTGSGLDAQPRPAWLPVLLVGLGIMLLVAGVGVRRRRAGD